MERFYDLIRQWSVPTNRAGMFPEQDEKMLNWEALQDGIGHEPRVLGSAYMLWGKKVGRRKR